MDAGNNWNIFIHRTFCLVKYWVCLTWIFTPVLHKYNATYKHAILFCFVFWHFIWLRFYYTPRTTKLLGGILVSLRPSVRPSVRLSVRLSRLPCPLCNIYSSGWILSILATNDHYHERVCLTQWPLTLTYIFKVIRPWLRKSCPLCSVYSSGWILFIFGTNDHYHKGVCRVLRFFQNLKIWIFSKFLKFFGLDLEKKIYSSRWILSIFDTNDN